MGSLYKHDVCKPDYVDHGMDKIEDPRLKSMILSSLTNTDSRWIIAYTPDFSTLSTAGLLMNAYTAGNLPDRDLHEFFVSRRHEDTYIGKAYSHGLIPR
jgi:hypothetical protein